MYINITDAIGFTLMPHISEVSQWFIPAVEYGYIMLSNKLSIFHAHTLIVNVQFNKNVSIIV